MRSVMPTYLQSSQNRLEHPKRFSERFAVQAFHRNSFIHRFSYHTQLSETNLRELLLWFAVVSWSLTTIYAEFLTPPESHPCRGDGVRFNHQSRLECCTTPICDRAICTNRAGYTNRAIGIICQYRCNSGTDRGRGHALSSRPIAHSRWTLSGRSQCCHRPHH